ncbi:MAG: universal stress protein [Gammaproteobacteria bacterium]
MVLARDFNARLELFLCDSEQAFILRHTYDHAGVEAALRACVARGMRYLEALRQSLADDVEISTHVSAVSPHYEAIVQRVLETKPDLVIKSAAGHHPLQRFALDANDWQLVRVCPAPLMLTRGRPWSARPTFAAAVDVSEREGTGLARSILHTAGLLAQGCHAQLDVVFSDPENGDAAAHDARTGTLNRLVHEFRVGNERLHVLHGDAEDTLPGFAARVPYDVLIMGALSRRKGLAALMGTLTSRLVDALESDFVLVKSGGWAGGVAEPARAVTA